ncbi:PH domain-containing protein [Aliicoccus persicus]|uniref:Putative membrane protein n=1 Tax=Aliicoccus persicus TaxID=930138 RepID=A0A662Z6V3_9STAP|nr:PH domain-containing protein [Aliicoccus persicus]SEW08858.1 putative membrane protein [Aliicoccus persicus]
MHEPQKLHPLAYLSSAFSFVKNMFVPIFLVALNTNFSNLNFIELVRSISTVAMLVLSIVVILIIVSALVEMLNIYRTRFWIEDNKFHYHDGVFVKREKELNIRRIDSVDISEPVYLRIFGASRLKVTTPGEGLTISVMKKTQANELQETLYYEKEKLEAIDEGQTESTDVIDEEVDETEEVSSAGASKSEPKERELLYAMTGRMLVLMAMTSGALGTFLAVILGIVGSFSGVFIEEIVERYFDVFENFISMPILAISVASILFVIFAYVMGTILLAVKYYDYKLYKRGEDLMVEYGLLEKKHQSVNINRVQGIVIEDSIIRRIFGFYSLSVIISSDALSLSEGGNKISLLPFVRRKQLYEVIHDIFPNYHMEVPPRKVPLRAYRRFFQIQALVIITATIVVQILYWEYAWIVGIVLFAAITCAGIYSARNTGYRIDESEDEINLMSTSFFSRSHYAMKRNRVIHVSTFTQPLLRFDKLAIIHVKMAAGLLGEKITLRYLDIKDIDKIWHWIKRGMKHEANIETRDHAVED